jgi:dienelactone hydrolase
MYKIFLFLSTLLQLTCYAQSPTGKWYAELNVYGNKIPLELKIEGNKKSWSGELLSPNQSDNAMNLESIVFKKKTLSFATQIGGISFEGKVTDENIDGTFTQNGMNFPLKFTIEKPKSTRPQTPQKPFNYYVEDVTFKNKVDKITLQGTFTRPNNKGKFPVAVLISGSGPQDRNSNILGHKSFMVIADDFCAKGIAVLRFDDRGTAKSGGNFAEATSFDFATDVKAAVDYLMTRDDVDTKRIGLIGHSEGGLIAPMVASERTDIAFIVLMAGTGVTGSELLLKQQELLLLKSGVSQADVKAINKINTDAYNIVKHSGSIKQQQESLRTYFQVQFDNFPKKLLGNTLTKDAFAQAQTSAISTPWMRTFLLLNPADALKNTKCPVLAINGTMDLQVDADQNLSAISDALKEGGNETFTIKRFKDLNHLFQKCKTGLPNEYGKIEQTIEKEVLDTMGYWVLNTIKQ